MPIAVACLAGCIDSDTSDVYRRVHDGVYSRADRHGLRDTDIHSQTEGDGSCHAYADGHSEADCDSHCHADADDHPKIDPDECSNPFPDEQPSMTGSVASAPR